MKNTQSGFTLIELMIVIAIIGILASVAIPQYQVYTQRTEATTAISSIRTVQLAVQEYYSVNGELPALFADLASTGINTAALTEIAAGTPLISGVAVADATAAITITFDANATGDLASATLIVTPTESNNVITFGIATGVAGGTLDIKYRPNL